jgi:CelD/BcsL family acetyltransferase involved in cellulose biosynthesis
MMALTLGENLFIKRVAELSTVESARWDDLHQATPDLRQAFMSRPYVAHVAQVNPGVRVVVAYADGQPAFFLPLQMKTGIPSVFGVYEPAGGVMTDYFGAVAGVGFKLTPSALLKAAKGRINAILFHHLDQDQSRFGLIGREQRIGLRTRLGTPPGMYWSHLRTIDKKLVGDTERRERKLQAEAGELSFEWQSSRPDEDLNWLIEAKRAQYARTGKLHAPLFWPDNVALMKSLGDAREKSCTGVLSVMRCGQQVVAAHLGLRCHDVLHVWFPVYDTESASYSPGRILLKHMFAAAAEAGIQVFDRGEGDTQAKRDFANDEHLYFRGLWLAPGLRGWLARLAIGIAWRMAKA